MSCRADSISAVDIDLFERRLCAVFVFDIDILQNLC